MDQSLLRPGKKQKMNTNLQANEAQAFIHAAGGDRMSMHAPDNMREGCQIIGFDWTYRHLGEQVPQHDGCARQELLGQSILETCPGIEDTEVFSAFRRAMDERISVSLEHRVRQIDGNETWLDVRIEPVPEGIFVLSINITGKKFEEARLRLRNQEYEAQVTQQTAALAAVNLELEALSSTISHDLRAPLRHMDGFARLAIEQFADAGEKTKTHLEKIIKASEKLNAMIEDLLVFSRTGRGELDIRAVDLQSLVLGIGQEYLGQARNREVHWSVNDLPPVQGDRALLRQVFANLIGNAFKFTRHCEQAVIEVRAEAKQNNEVEISVRDNGTGFDMRFVDKLYGVFKRLHHEREFEGTGIGLATVRKIVGRLGGKTWARGEPGLGAVFYVSLKLAADA
jgi:signal transduction histidine kinase